MPTITIPQREFYKWNGITKEQYDLLVFNIGMIELISYWKATCSPTIVVKPYSLNEEQIKFWQKLYYNGLSEFFYAVHDVAKSQTQLSDFSLTFHFHALEKEMATHSSVLAWRIPGVVEPGGLPSMGLHRVGYD